MKILRFVTVFLLLLIAFSVILKHPVSALATYRVTVNAKFTTNGTPKTYPSVIATVMDGDSGTPLSANFANGGWAELPTTPTKFWIKILASENGKIVFTHQSDIFEPTATDTFTTYTPTIETETINGPVTTTTPSPSAGAAGTPTPTPPTEGAGWCGDDATVRAGFLPVPAGTTPPCAMKDAVYVPRTSSPKDAYCDRASSGAKPFFYKCSVATSGTPTPTPTPVKRALEGEACIPSQGPWQCMQNNYCAQTCTSFGVSCTTGKCCPDNKVWLGTTCGVPASTPTPTPVGAKPTPITTSGKCDDVILTAAGSVSQACIKAASCIAPDVENSGGNTICSQFYGGTSTGYVCCQKPVVNSGSVGSSCSVTNRLCDTNLNSATGTNNQCTGCGGYCIKPSSGEPAFCQSI